MIPSANDSDVASPAPPTETPVIDLRDGPTTRVRISRTDNPFAALPPPERMRLIIRVLCELVAYDELDGAGNGPNEARNSTDTSGPTRPTSITG